MLRRANEHEAAAFFLVERTMRRTQPRMGSLGLATVEGPDGRIERGSLGHLRVRFDGRDSDAEPENLLDSRPPSETEVTLWQGLEKLMVVANPIADPGWTLVSMRIGSRVLRRLPHGGVLTSAPKGTPPFRGASDLTRSRLSPKPEIPRPTEDELLRSIDGFLLQRDGDEGWAPGELLLPWKPPRASSRPASHIVSASLGNGHRHGRSKWHKCPLCHTPVIKGEFNPRIPYGSIRPGQGAIRDLRGGYLSRLRETYIIGDPETVLSGSESSLESQSESQSQT
ncbi:MAG TPA: hypothetical protein VEY12_03455 [Thermoplasmata archaeon]|nr:hypothetical protein [Thermoplasmata archaeon]